MDASVLSLLIPIVAILIGGLVVLVPIAGLTARFALKPLMEALAQYRSLQGEGQRVELLERRLALLEEQVHSHDRAFAKFGEQAEFDRQLQAPE
ncbi:MAG: hypothetical protein ACR2F9_07880 [Longimicrobiaceae bacterium]